MPAKLKPKEFHHKERKDHKKQEEPSFSPLRI